MAAFQDLLLSVPDGLGPTELLQFLSENLPIAIKRIQRAIEEGGVYVNRKRCKKTDLELCGGEKLRIVILDHETLVPFTEQQLLWQQTPYFLIHKKSGQYAQEALHRSGGTLPDELAKHLKLKRKFAHHLRPVHRLDRDTSGLMLFCSDPKQLQQLQALWHSHVQKTYLAVVSPAPDWDEQRITLAIGSRRDRQGCYHVEANGRACDTEAKVVQRVGNMALLRLIPHTGRTHQLRIHLSHLGCPILGDTRYGGKRHSRLMLHAQGLYVQVPALPEEHQWNEDPQEDWQWH